MILLKGAGVLCGLRRLMKTSVFSGIGVVFCGLRNEGFLVDVA